MLLMLRLTQKCAVVLEVVVSADLVFNLYINMNSLIWIAATIFILELVHGERNPFMEAKRPWESVQDYLIVRPGALMFYWLYYADGTRVGAGCKPLVIWLQGGLSAASGIANFLDIGPLTMDMEPRNDTWVKGRNILLLDHPVGTGFSFVRDNSLLAETDQDMATDLFNAVKEFLRRHEEFRNTPTYILGAHYGGKISPILAYYLHTGIEEVKVKMNLHGVGIINALVDPTESITTGIELLYHMGLMDQNLYEETILIVKVMRHFINAGYYRTGLKMYLLLTQNLAEKVEDYVHNKIITQTKFYSLETIMNTYVKPTLLHTVDQDLEWKQTSVDVTNRSILHYLDSSTEFVEMLLNYTKLKVAVYNDNSDFHTPLSGASNWVQNLKWRGSKKFKWAKRQEIRGTNIGFYKVANQLSFWGVFNAGQFEPEQNQVALEHFLEYVMSDQR